MVIIGQRQLSLNAAQVKIAFIQRFFSSFLIHSYSPHTICLVILYNLLPIHFTYIPFLPIIPPLPKGSNLPPLLSGLQPLLELFQGHILLRG